MTKRHGLNKIIVLVVGVMLTLRVKTKRNNIKSKRNGTSILLQIMHRVILCQQYFQMTSPTSWLVWLEIRKVSSFQEDSQRKKSLMKRDGWN